MDVDLARHQWDDGRRRVEAARGEAARYATLVGQVDAVVAALRGRVGQTFTLAELAAAYDGADGWVRDLLDDDDPEVEPVTEAGTVTDAAFYNYARGATDYRP